MGVFDLKAVPGNTQTQINARGTPAGIKWAATRFPWIKVTSRSKDCKFLVLDSKGGDDAYFGIGRKDLRPKPIVTGVDVKKQGELGTTRRATIKIIAFHDDDIEPLQKCYFIPGMSVMVEWGWSVTVDGGVVKELSPGVDTDIEVSKKIRAHSEGHPCYDGLQGIVTTFSFNLTEQNVWECSIEITAAAENILEVSAENMECSKDCARKSKEDEKKPAKAHSGLWTFLYDLFDDFEKASGRYTSYGTFSLYKIMAAGRDADGNEKTSLLEDMNVNDKDTEEPFITWATFEYLINKNILGKGIGGDPKQNPVGRLDTNNGGMKLKSTPYTESSDPRVCIVGGSPNAPKIYKQSKGKFPAVPAWGPKEIDLSKIMVNCMFLLGEVRAMEQSSDKTLSTLLKNILSKINVVCGDLWSFGIVTHPGTDSKNPVVCIVDTNVIGNAPPAAYLFPSVPNNSAVRSFSLNLKLAEGMKTQALYASKAASSGTTCTGYGVAAFGNGSGTLSDINGAIKPIPKKKECDCEGANEKAASLSLEEAFDILDDKGDGEVTDESCDTVRVLIKEAIDKAQADNAAETPEKCKGSPLPFELAVSLDGVGGFGFGQVVSALRVPLAIRTNFIHQVTAVEHSVTAQDWVTTVNTVARLNK